MRRLRLKQPNKRLASLRKKRGLNQEQLGIAVGLSQSMVARIESGDREPSSPIKLSLAKFFNVTIEWLFYEEIYDQKSLCSSLPTGTED